MTARYISKKSFTLNDWAPEDKPREKLLSHGKKSLTNAELIAILLRSGVPGKNVVETAIEILNAADNSLSVLSRMGYNELMAFHGMGEAKATTLMAALELGLRLHSEQHANANDIIGNSTDLFHYLMSLMVDLDHEEFWAVYLNSRHKVLTRQRISVGGQTETSVDIRILLRGALESKATAMAVAHNHPSGSNKPSQNDRSLTRRIAEASALMGIKLIDHLIISRDGQDLPCYYSFADQGEL